jgi:hypothetical protein
MRDEEKETQVRKMQMQGQNRQTSALVISVGNGIYRGFWLVLYGKNSSEAYQHRGA